MAGGIWTSQNKVQPGVYINTKSRGNLSASIGEKGIAAIAKPLSWGPSGVMMEIIPGEDVTPYVGYDATSEKARFLQEMMKGSDSTPGPIKILLYRPKGTGGAKASAALGELTVTALYEGVRGNDVTVMIQEEPDTPGTFDVMTVVDGRTADEQRVKKAEELKGNAWVAFSGTPVSLEATAGITLSGGKDPDIEAADHSAFLAALETYQFDIVIYDGVDPTVRQAYASFVKRISENSGLKCQAVMAEAADSGSEWVISLKNGVKLSDGTVLEARQAVWWLGGAEAGAPYNKSLTYARYPNAAEAFPKLTDAELTEAIQSGQIALIDTFGSVKVCTDINTLTSYTVEKGQEYSNNRVMRTLNQFCNDVYKQFSLYYIGKTDNNETGRGLLKGWIVGYLNEMQANNGIQNFVSDDVTVKAGNSVESVVIEAALQPVGSIEKIYMTVMVSVNTGTE